MSEAGKAHVAVVTGGSRGIGRAAVRRLAASGAAVCVNYARSAVEAETIVREVREAGGRAIAVQADVGEAPEVQRMVDLVERELGPVTILVNNAGVSYRATLDEYDRAGVQRLRRTNVEGVIHAIRAVAPGMRERGYGRIVNVSSIAAHGTTLPGNAFYAASKAEVVILTRRFAMELGPFGITVNAVAPGFIVTDLTRHTRGGQDYAEVTRQLAERAMVRRVGEPADVAHAIAFLAAPESGFVTAQTITVDGGRMDYIGHP